MDHFHAVRVLCPLPSRWDYQDISFTDILVIPASGHVVGKSLTGGSWDLSREFRIRIRARLFPDATRSCR
jgi:hypothetical protein